MYALSHKISPKPNGYMLLIITDWPYFVKEKKKGNEFV